MAGRVAGKVAFITGAARGQGRSHAIKLAQEGADIIAVDIAAPLKYTAFPPATPDDLAETVAAVEALDRRIVAEIKDVRDHDGLKDVVDRGVAELGRLDIVIANAATCTPASWDEIEPDRFQDTLDINVTGVWNTVMAGAPHLVAAGGGSVILISSAAGLKVQPYMVHYTASKFAVTGMSKAFAVELGQHNIRVNSIHPTGVRTDMGGEKMLEVLGRAMDRYHRPAAMFTNILDVDAVDPEDISNAVLFLASDESKFVTAHALAVDAGVSQF